MRVACTVLFLIGLSSPIQASLLSEVRSPPRGLSNALHIQLSPHNGTLITAEITNVFDKPLSLLTYGTILDNMPGTQHTEVELNGKVWFMNIESKLTYPGKPILWVGIHVHIDVRSLPLDAFISIPPKSSISRTWDVARTHDLSPGGNVSISLHGAIPYTHPNSTKLLGSILYAAPTLQLLNINIAYHDTTQGSLESRSIISGDYCTNDQHYMLKAAAQDCARIASMAGAAASHGSTFLFNKHFKRTSPATRGIASARFHAVSQECLATVNDFIHKTTLICDDYVGDKCRQSTFGVTVMYNDGRPEEITLCPLFFQMPKLSDQCEGYDQVFVLIHELTHCDNVYHKRTEDYAYGAEDSAKLSGDLALYNADSYSFFSNAVSLGCDNGSESYQEKSKSSVGGWGWWIPQ
jgi:deuterolysin